jgi:hypothetical protein
MIYRGPGFQAVVLFGSSPIPSLPPLPFVSSTGDIQEYSKERQLADGKGEGMSDEPNHTAPRKLVLYKSFNTLCCNFITFCFRVSVLGLPHYVFRFPYILVPVLFLPDPPLWYMFCYPFWSIHLSICSFPSLYLFSSTFVPVSVCNDSYTSMSVLINP